MPRIYVRDANFVLADVIPDFDTTEEYLSADAIVCWNDIEGEFREIVLTGNFLGIPTVVMQHGLRATREYAPPHNAPLIAEKIMVWGPKDKERLLQAGVEEDRVIVTGTTLFDHLIPKKAHEGINVVFAPMHWDREIDENLVLAGKLREIRGITLVTKIIEGMNASHFDNPIYSNRHAPDHLAICASVLSTADLVVSINEGTFEFLAYAMDIPVLTVDLWEPKLFGNRLYFPENGSLFSNACQKISIDQLSQAIAGSIANPGQFSAERKKALFDEAGVGWDNSSPHERISKAIDDAIHEGQIRLQNQSRERIMQLASQRLTRQMKLKSLSSRPESDATKDWMIQALTAQIDRKDQALTAQVAEKEQVVQALTSRLAKKEQAVQMLSSQLDEIRNSSAWRYLQPLRRAWLRLKSPRKRQPR